MADFIADKGFAKRLKELEEEKRRLFGTPADEPETRADERRLGLALFELGEVSFFGDSGVIQIKALKAVVDEAARQGIQALRLEGYAAVNEKSQDGMLDAPMIALRRREYVHGVLRALNYTGTILTSATHPRNIVTPGFVVESYLARRVDVRVVEN